MGGRTLLFYRWEGQRLTDTDCRPIGIALRANPSCGEESVQSPYVLKDGGVYHMFYTALTAAYSWGFLAVRK